MHPNAASSVLENIGGTRIYRATRALLDSVIAQGDAPGGVAMIGRGDAAADVVAAGVIDFDSETPAGEDTLWRIYSMTKPITGMAAMLLIHEGVIGLDQPLADVLPEFAEMRVLTAPQVSLANRPAARPITMRHLLTHTAGFGYALLLAGPLLGEYQRLGLTPSRHSRSDAPPAPSLRDFCARLAALPLVADPGACWSYSVALDVVGAVIEAASGQRFDQFLQQRFFKPLGMASTGFSVELKDAPRLATNYVTLDEGTTALDPGGTSIFLEPPAFPFGGTGLVSSAGDIDRFLRMLLNHGHFEGAEIMPAEAVRLGMSNLLPEGADLGGFMWWPDAAMMGFGPSGHGSGFGAGARVALGGYDCGTYAWFGAASTSMFVDPVRNLRGAAYVNSMSASFKFAALIDRAMVRDVAWAHAAGA